jgi:hypothetical protein
LNFYVSLNAHFKTSYFNITLCPALVLFEKSVCIDWIIFCCIRSLIKIYFFVVFGHWSRYILVCIRSLIKIYLLLYSVTDQDIFFVVFGHWSRYIFCCIRSLIKIYSLLYSVTDQDIFFLVPDSCIDTLRNGNSISAKNHAGHYCKRLEQRLFLLFSENLVQLFWTFWHCMIINTIHVYVHCR